MHLNATGNETHHTFFFKKRFLDAVDVYGRELVLTVARVCVSAMVKFRKLPPERTKLLVRLNKMCLC